MERSMYIFFSRAKNFEDEFILEDSRDLENIELWGSFIALIGTKGGNINGVVCSRTVVNAVYKIREDIDEVYLFRPIFDFRCACVGMFVVLSIVPR